MLVCCQVAEKACHSCSDLLINSCSWLCPRDRPSPLFAVWSFAMNIAMIAVAAANLAKDAGKTCSNSSAMGWHIAFFPVCVINMAFSIYLYWRFVLNLQKGNRACSAMSKLLLYDIGVYLYIWVYIFMIVWICVGGTMCGGETVCTALGANAAMLALLGSYVGLSVVMLLLSVCVQCCNERRHRRRRLLCSATASPASSPSGRSS